MKPAAQPIDPAKRTEVIPERTLTHAEASTLVRVFLVLLAVPFVFELGRWTTGKNLLSDSAHSGMQRLLTWDCRRAMRTSITAKTAGSSPKTNSITS